MREEGDDEVGVGLHELVALLAHLPETPLYSPISITLFQFPTAFNGDR
jgi:hypothetical protein